MPIDDKPPRVWDEADLQELCAQRRRETQTLDFKGKLHLGTEGQKKEVERDALGMATGGGGVILYGIEEVELSDGAKAAGRLSGLQDGTLRDQLERVLDSRGEPRLPFQLHPEIELAAGGFVLVLEVFGRRRPHRAQDGRFYARRGMNVRPMSEAEVAEAYRDRFLRDARALEPLFLDRGATGLPADVETHIHRGLKPNELALWREETGEVDPPGWMTVVVFPMPPQRGLLDPVRDAERFLRPIVIENRWDEDHLPLEFFHLIPVANGLLANLPPRDDTAPAYLVSMSREGVMEYGTTLEPGLRDPNPTNNRVIFSGSHPAQAHDYLLAFAVALGELGYGGPVAAQVSFEHTRGTRLVVGPEYGMGLHSIAAECVRGDVWRGERSELFENAGRIVKEVTDRVFLAAGSRRGNWFIDEQGRLLRDGR